MKSLRLAHSLLLIISLCITSQSKTAEPFSVASATSWIAAVTVDSLSSFSEQMRHRFYGDADISQSCKDSLRTAISALNLQQPTDIKQSYEPWNVIAGHLFSNQDTLFISEKMYKDITALINEKGGADILANLKTEDKKELITALLMITADYDNKVLALSIITPIAVWCLARLTHFILHKVSYITPLNPVTQTCYKLAKKFRNSFVAKTLTSAAIVGCYIVYQRHLFNQQAQALL